MSEYLRKYNNLSDKKADNGIPEDASSVSMAGEESVIDGVNVIKENVNGIVAWGDHLVYDKTEKKCKFVQFGTFKPSLLDSRFVDARAIFICNIAGKPFILGVDEVGSPAFAAYGKYILSGFDLTAGGTVTITTTSGAGSFTYAAGSTMAQVLAAFNAGRTGYFKNYAGAVVSGSQLNVSSWPQITAVTGCTLTKGKCCATDGSDVEFNPSWGELTNVTGGVVTEIGYNAMNMMGQDAGFVSTPRQYAVYMANNGGTTFGDEKTQFMNKATFDALNASGDTDKQALYDKYNGVYADYADYCASLRGIDYDVMFKTAKWSLTGKEATETLDKVKVYDFDGTTKLDAFPACSAAMNYGIATAGFLTGLEAGNWHEVGVGELTRVLRYSPLNSSEEQDTTNKAIIEAGGTRIYGSNSYALAAARAVSTQLGVWGDPGASAGRTRIGGHAMRVALAFEYES